MESVAMSDEELIRLERKIDEIQKSMASVVRLEERTATLFRGHDSLKDRVGDLERDFGKMALKSAGAFAERIFWLLLTTTTGVVVYYITRG